MPIVEPELTLLRIPRLAALATSARPAWLWTADASRILWANAVGAAMFGTANVSACRERRFAATDPTAAQIVRFAATLPPAAQERLERLRGLAGFGRVLTCACSRIVGPDGVAAVLVAAAEPAGPSLSLCERVHRLFAEDSGALAVFAPDGRMLHASGSALRQLAGASTVSALGIEALVAEALEAGRASGTIGIPHARIAVTAARLGEGDTRVILLTLSPPPASDSGGGPGNEASAAAPPAAGGEARAADTAPLVMDAEPTPTAATAGADEAQDLVPEAAPDDQANGERRHPLRFVWQTDAEGHFVIGSDEFIELVGPRATAACGRLWREIASVLDLDPDNQVARALTTQETWSGNLIFWPVDNSSERLPIELSGVPVFDHGHDFRGYRGFGVCRNIAHVNRLARLRREQPVSAEAAIESVPAADIPRRPAPTAAAVEAPPRPERSAAPAAAPGPAALTVSAVAAAANVVPFRGPSPETKAPSLSAVERKAFRDLAQELTARLRGTQDRQRFIEPADEEAAGEATNASPAAEAVGMPGGETATSAAAAPASSAGQPPGMTPAFAERLLERIPAGVAVCRDGALLYANRHLLDIVGYDSLDAVAAAGGLNSLFAAPGPGALTESGVVHPLSLISRRGDRLPVEGRLFTVPWDGASVRGLVLADGHHDEALAAAEREIHDLKSNRDRAAKREAQKAAAVKSDFLAKVSHEIRTPLNAMIGFLEVILAERFGSIGNERYREYLQDIHTAGTHLVALLNDLLDLSKVETGQLDLTFANVDLNDLTQQCVGIMQPQANRARIIIRSSLTPDLPHVVADQRSLRQIVLNLLSNAIKFTGPGAQVIVSTAPADNGGAVLRVRDTGAGMSEQDIEAALEPFRQTATAGSLGSGGTGLGLPLTKALAEANRAHFSIKSGPNAGTLVEVAFPASRAVAE